VVLQCANYGRKKQDQNAQKGGVAGRPAHMCHRVGGFRVALVAKRKMDQKIFACCQMRCSRRRRCWLTWRRTSGVELSAIFLWSHTHTHAHLTIPYIQNDIYVKDIYTYIYRDRAKCLWKFWRSYALLIELKDQHRSVHIAVRNI